MTSGWRAARVNAMAAPKSCAIRSMERSPRARASFTRSAAASGSAVASASGGDVDALPAQVDVDQRRGGRERVEPGPEGSVWSSPGPPWSTQREVRPGPGSSTVCSVTERSRTSRVRARTADEGTRRRGGRPGCRGRDPREELSAAEQHGRWAGRRVREVKHHRQEGESEHRRRAPEEWSRTGARCYEPDRWISRPEMRCSNCSATSGAASRGSETPGCWTRPRRGRCPLRPSSRRRSRCRCRLPLRPGPSLPHPRRSQSSQRRRSRRPRRFLFRWRPRSYRSR